MGFWLGGKSTVSTTLMVALRDHQAAGVFSSIQPEFAIQDLRHPIRSARSACQSRNSHVSSYPHGRFMLRKTGRIAESFALGQGGPSAKCNRATMLEDRPDG